MKEVTKKVVWDAKGERGGPIEGTKTVMVPESWDELQTLSEADRDEMFRAAVTQYVTTECNRYREGELAIPDRETVKALDHWFYNDMPEDEFPVHKGTIAKIKKLTGEDRKKAIRKFLDKVSPLNR
ncbi:MAG: hypothetical protein Unbinned400contig1000_8 [Prokaryotic dsDNA virus sp.]|nr:MAG: hypothetical protein Unbinned400contig1000_8 [Prokaryotic dsDNA virus sp.]|tara:strand:- start:69 stop:446 length:378 start_codon:yes stop_codon:yes gene_type:complete